MPRKSSAPSPTFPLAITKHQREALVCATRLRPKIKSRLKPIEGTVVEFTLTELNQMLDEVGTSAEFAPDPYCKRLVDLQRKIVILLDAVQVRADAAKLRSRRPKPYDIPLFQFKVTLLDVKPAIWRRIQTKDCTLAELHNHIQAASAGRLVTCIGLSLRAFRMALGSMTTSILPITSMRRRPC
jgi:hypothetical protein